ncbi:amino acid ABC transporter substrate-binding protein [Asticcacaulis sp. W401b]|uniref:amino acid ABC transporter substrate-binding protein n=1 Tax=Asticcacaulis sp. W401b TaxID=3388666 RepID=UPI0039705EE5
MSVFRLLSRLAAPIALAGLVCGLTACGQGQKTTDDKPPAKAPEAALPPTQSDSATLKAVLTRGRVNCGVHPGLIGFSYKDNSGRWRGFDADFCRALAAAIFSDADKVTSVPLTTTERFEALKTGKVDVLWRSTSWTLSRDAADQVDYAGINYYDGQGFLVRKSLRLNSATELNGARICVQTGSTSELNLADFFRARGLKYNPVVVKNEDEGRDAYAASQCDALSSDVSALAAARTTLSDPTAHTILPEIISKEPLGPVVRQGDDQWTDIVRWTLYATIVAEELGVTSQSVKADQLESQNPEVRRLLGSEGNLGGGLGLGPEWAYNIVSQVGNYGEIFDRNIGADSPLKLSRGLNAQWNAPERGLLYSPPVR